MPEYSVTLLSGGLDSTTVAAYPKDRVDNMSAITFHYGQTHSKEVDCAAQIAGILGIEHELLDISFLSKVAWYSALTNPDRFPLPADRSGEEIGYGVPITYVPMRNTIFLSLATACLESRVLHAIGKGYGACFVRAYDLMDDLRTARAAHSLDRRMRISDLQETVCFPLRHRGRFTAWTWRAASRNVGAGFWHFSATGSRLSATAARCAATDSWPRQG